MAYYNLPVSLLCTCIDSILALSLQPDEREVIIVDDGSDVSPMNDLLKYGDDIIYVRQKNSGLSSARNKGIEVATGEFLQFVDADDRLIKTGFNYCLDIIRNNHDADMVLFDFDENQFETTDVPTEKVVPTSGTSYMRHNNIHGMACGYLFRKTTLSDLRFTNGIYHEDEEFTPQLLIRAETVYPTKAKAYYYHHHANSITTSNDATQIEKRLSDTMQVIKRLHYLADRLPNNDQLAMERRVAQLTMDYIHNVILQTRSLTSTLQCINALRSEGLFPLPNRNYTKKYQWFRRLTSTKFGISVLVRILPLMKKER